MKLKSNETLSRPNNGCNRSFRRITPFCIVFELNLICPFRQSTMQRNNQSMVPLASSMVFIPWLGQLIPFTILFTKLILRIAFIKFAVWQKQINTTNEFYLNDLITNNSTSTSIGSCISDNNK